jgi:hypothetical protein
MDVQATGEAFFYFCGSFCPSETESELRIQIRIQTHNTASTSVTLNHMKAFDYENNFLCICQ